MSNIYKWGILGPGKIAHEFARALSVTEQGKLWGVASRSMEKAQNFADQYAAPMVYASYDELIEDPEIDVIYIATPHHLHYPLSRTCIEKGKAVLCEKPIAINAKQFSSLSELAQDKNVFYMDALWTRFLPTIIKTEELLENLGEIISLRADFGFRADFDPQSRLFNPALGGGSLLDIGIYPAFLALLLLGYPDEVQSSAQIGKTGVDENMAMLLKYQKGALATLQSTLLADTKTEAEIACTGGTVIIHARFHMPTYLELRKRGEEAKFYRFDYRKNGYEYEAEEVMSCLDQGLIQSPKLNHGFTRELMNLLDEVREQNGLHYGSIEAL
jgi:predicted dehydrogenase